MRVLETVAPGVGNAIGCIVAAAYGVAAFGAARGDFPYVPMVGGAR